MLLLSVDGLHQSDIAWYVEHHPSSALAKLVHRGVSSARLFATSLGIGLEILTVSAPFTLFTMAQ